MAAAFCVPSQGFAQEPALIDGSLSVGGVPADSGWVVLHQVSALVSGEIDSVFVGPDGRFSITLPHAPGAEGEGEVFFLSHRYSGILYFGDPIGSAAQFPLSYGIEAFPSVSAIGDGSDLVLSVRNLLLEPIEGGWQATDLFGLQNPGAATLTPSDSGAVWGHVLPEGASGFTVGQSDLAPGATTFEGGGFQVASAFAPGEQHFLIRYQLPPGAVTIPIRQRPEQFEVLAFDPQRTLSLDGLLEADPIVLDGVEYRRFAGVRLAPTDLVLTTQPDNSGRTNPFSLLAVVLALALVLVGAFLAFRASKDQVNRKDLLLEIAKLDEAQAGPEALSTDAYEAKRARLIQLLSPRG